MKCKFLQTGKAWLPFLKLRQVYVCALGVGRKGKKAYSSFSVNCICFKSYAVFLFFK